MPTPAQPASASISVLEQARADVDAERLGEAEIGGEREREADQRVAQRLAAAEAVRHQHEQHDRGEREAERADQRDVGDQAGDDEAERRPVDRRPPSRRPAASRRAGPARPAGARRTGTSPAAVMYGKDGRPDLRIERRYRDRQRLPRRPRAAKASSPRPIDGSGNGHARAPGRRRCSRTSPRCRSRGQLVRRPIARIADEGRSAQRVRRGRDPSGSPRCVRSPRRGTWRRSSPVSRIGVQSRFFSSVLPGGALGHLLDQRDHRGPCPRR